MGPQPSPELRDSSLVLHGVTWDQYQSVLDTFRDRRLPHTYAEGTLELMSPSQKHELESEFLCRLIQRATEELDQEIVSLGSWTLSKHDTEKGLEPDSCFYLANEPAVRFKEEINLDRDPPPDLAIEIDVTSSSVERMPVYAAMGVAELWRYDGENVHFYQLVDGKYHPRDNSSAFPFLPATKLQELLAARRTKTELQLVKEFVAWVREQQG